MKQAQILFIAIFTIILSISLQAQQRWSVEGRSNLSIATKDFIDTELGIGFGFDGIIAYRFLPHLAVYGGWGWNHFNAEKSFAGSDIDFEETGYTFGLQFVHPIGNSKLNYLLQAGALFNHIEAENQEGDLVADSDHGLGWQISGGLTIPLAKRLELVPRVGYHSLRRDLKAGSVATRADQNYVSASVGLAWSF